MPSMFTATVLEDGAQAGTSSLNNRGEVAYVAPGSMARWLDASGVHDIAAGMPSRVSAANDAGQVTGFLQLADGSTKIFLWTAATGMVQAIDTETGIATTGNAINASGQAAGNYSRHGFTYGIRWTPTGPSESLFPVDVDTNPAFSSSALFINAQGSVAGSSTVPGGRLHAALWVPGQAVRDLGSFGGADSSVAALNDANQVVGEASFVGGASHAFRWSLDEGLRDLGTLGGRDSAARSINASGWVAGSSALADGAVHAFVWRDGAMQDLGTLGGTASSAMAMNVNGWIGGSATLANGTEHAFVWTPADGMVDLNSRLGTGAGFEARSVVALADDGSLLVQTAAGRLVLLRPAG